jgi:hypothetical protein
MDFIYAVSRLVQKLSQLFENRAVISFIAAGDYALTPADSWGPAGCGGARHPRQSDADTPIRAVPLLDPHLASA